MKTITRTTSKTHRRASYLTLLLAALTLALGPHWMRAADAVPFKGSAEAAIVSAVPGPDGVLLMVHADGNATQLGRFSREEMVILNPVAGTIAGTIVFTAANGDQLFVAFAGGFTSPTTTVGTYTITGGTGRFENATGAAAFQASTSDGVHFTVEFGGSISSVGANKK